jgi:hypothetical protein
VRSGKWEAAFADSLPLPRYCRSSMPQNFCLECPDSPTFRPLNEAVARAVTYSPHWNPRRSQPPQQHACYKADTTKLTLRQTLLTTALSHPSSINSTKTASCPTILTRRLHPQIPSTIFHRCLEKKIRSTCTPSKLQPLPTIMRRQSI